jgi:hypothetical protein
MKKLLIFLIFISSFGFGQSVADTTIYEPSAINEFINWCYSVRYRLFKDHIKPKVFEGEKITVDLSRGNKLSNDYIVGNSELNMVFKPECISVENNTAKVFTIPYNDSVNNGWQEKQFCRVKSGWYDFYNTYPIVYGAWEVTFSCSKRSKPAIWMLKERHPEPETSYQVKVDSIKGNQIYFKREKPVNYNWFVYSNTTPLGAITAILSDAIEISNNVPLLPVDSILTISKDCITPEVDLFENINGEFAQSVHWNTSLYIHKREWMTAFVCDFEPDKIYTVAVTVTPTKHTFYVDGIKTGVVWADTPSNAPSYLIFSNGTNLEGIFGVNTLTVYSANIYK